MSRENFNLITDILDIVKNTGNDTRYTVNINLTDVNVTVKLIDMEYDENDDDLTIPISFDTVFNEAYIDRESLYWNFKCREYGLDENNVKIMLAIMHYLNEHSQDLKSLFNSMKKKVEDKDDL